MQWNKLDKTIEPLISDNNTLWLMTRKINYNNSWQYEIVLRKDGHWYFAQFFAIDNIEDLMDHFTHYYRIHAPE